MRNEPLSVLGIESRQAYDQAFCCEDAQAIPVHRLRWLPSLVFSGWRTRVLRKHFAHTRCRLAGKYSGTPISQKDMTSAAICLYVVWRNTLLTLNFEGCSYQRDNRSMHETASKAPCAGRAWEMIKLATTHMPDNKKKGPRRIP